MTTIEQEPLLQGLREVGLNRYEALVYLGLVTDRNAKVTEISKRTGVPQPKVYQALDSLVDKGFCALGTDSINRYRPVDPDVAVSGHIRKLGEQQEAARDLAQGLTELLTSGEGQDLWAPPLEILKGIRQINPILKGKLDEAAEEVLFLGQGPIVSAIDIPRALQRASQRGVSTRLIYEASYLQRSQEHAPEEVELYRNMPGAKRVSGELPSKLVLIDRKQAFVSVAPAPDASFLIMVLRHPGLVRHFLASFEYYWAKSEPLA